MRFFRMAKPLVLSTFDLEQVLLDTNPIPRIAREIAVAADHAVTWDLNWHWIVM
jgi:hypothetical protein